MDVRFDFDIDDLDSMVKNEAMAVAKERARACGASGTVKLPT